MTCDLSTGEIKFVEDPDSWFGLHSLPGELPVCGLKGEKCLSETDEGFFLIKKGITCSMKCENKNIFIFIGLITGLIPAAIALIVISFVVLVRINR
jgi:hypothetical protein